MAAIRILAHSGHLAATELLAHAVGDEDADVGMVALSALGASNDPSAIGILLNALRQGRRPASRVAAHLDRSPQHIADKLTRLLQDEDAVVRLWAATLLARYADVPGLEDQLAPLASDPDPRVRKAAVGSLGKIGGDIAPDVALRLLRDPVAFVRAHAARALGNLGLPGHADSVAALLGDSDWWVRRAAKDSLEMMGPEVWPVLFRCLDHPDRFVGNGAAEVFQNLGILDSLVLLEAATDNPGRHKIAMLQRIVAAGGTRLTDSLVDRCGPILGPRVRDLLDTIGLRHAGAA